MTGTEKVSVNGHIENFVTIVNFISSLVSERERERSKCSLPVNLLNHVLCRVKEVGLVLNKTLADLYSEGFQDVCVWCTRLAFA